MLYELFHKNIPVFTIEYEPRTGKFGEIADIKNDRHIPVGLCGIEQYDLRQAFQFWWESRLVPKNRKRAVQNKLELAETVSSSYGFNLSDHYWIRPKGADITWERYNCYTNLFDEDFGKFITGQLKSFAKMSSNSPDIFSNGEQDKRWTILNGKRILLKYGKPPYYEQPFNEVLASEICRRLGFPHVKYSFAVKGNENPLVYSVCPCFTDENTEFVPAGFVQYALKKEKGISSYNHLILCCKKLGMADIEKIEAGLSQMMLIDYITGNEDRHFGNFGFIRNAETLEWKGFAPLFDTGNSMFFEYPTSDLRKSRSVMDNVACKTFDSSQNGQLKKYAEKIAALNVDFSKLDGIEKFYQEILSHNPKVDEERRILLSDMFSQRIAFAKETVYSEHSVSKQFLYAVSGFVSDPDFLKKVSSVYKSMVSRNSSHKIILNNFMRSLKAKDEQDYKQKLLNKISEAVKKGNKKK